MAPNSPDQYPVDNKIWEVMQQRVYEMQIHNFDERKQRLVDFWSGLQQSVVDAAVNASVGASSREGITFLTSAVGCFDNGMKLSMDSLCAMCFWSFS